MENNESKQQYALALDRMKQNRRWYAIVEAAMFRLGLTYFQVIVYAYICSLAERGPIAVRSIADFTRASKRHVFRALTVLETAGLIARSNRFQADNGKRRQLENSYTPLWHEALGEIVKGPAHDGNGGRKQAPADPAGIDPDVSSNITGRDSRSAERMSSTSLQLSKEKEDSKQADNGDSGDMDRLLGPALLVALQVTVHGPHYAGCERVLMSFARNVAPPKASVVARVSVQKLLKAGKKETLTNPPGLLTAMLRESLEELDVATTRGESTRAEAEKRLAGARSGFAFCRCLREWHATHEALATSCASPALEMPAVAAPLVELTRDWLTLERKRLAALRRNDGLIVSQLLDAMDKLQSQIDRRVKRLAAKEAAE